MTAYFKKQIKELSEERKRDIPLPVYISWWIVRLLLFYALIQNILMQTRDRFVLYFSVNLFICFLVTVFKLFPKDKFMLSRLTFRTQTVVIAVNLVTTFIGGYVRFYDDVAYWDTGIHFLGAIAGVYVGYEITVAAMKKPRDLQPGIAVICGVGWCCWAAIMWESFEFLFDHLTGENVQFWDAQIKSTELFKTAPERFALLDTMTDLIAGLIGSMIGGVILYIILVRRAKKAALNQTEAVQAAVNL